MLKRVDPLRNELKSLESQADENKHKAQEIIKVSQAWATVRGRWQQRPWSV